MLIHQKSPGGPGYVSGLAMMKSCDRWTVATLRNATGPGKGVPAGFLDRYRGINMDGHENPNNKWMTIDAYRIVDDDIC